MVKERVRAILKQVLESEIPDGFSQSMSENWDSIHHLAILVTLEKEFDISFTPEEIGRVDSFEMLVSVVEKKYEKNTTSK
ncbi:MAG: acyl carrier protein [Elusimicrobiaceae bacterium]|nr:acyl carrier protein [Elusimicrobiaceae bacterium]